MKSSVKKKRLVPYLDALGARLKAVALALPLQASIIAIETDESDRESRDSGRAGVRRLGRSRYGGGFVTRHRSNSYKHIIILFK